MQGSSLQPGSCSWGYKHLVGSHVTCTAPTCWTLPECTRPPWWQTQQRLHSAECQGRQEHQAGQVSGSW